MNSNITRRIRHPLGDTDPFDVERGLAQGAVESPWIYNCFIDGLTKDLKNRGFGISIAGRKVPHLLYADDIVLLANSDSELHNMNKIATDYARKTATSLMVIRAESWSSTPRTKSGPELKNKIGTSSGEKWTLSTNTNTWEQ